MKRFLKRLVAGVLTVNMVAGSMPAVNIFAAANDSGLKQQSGQVVLDMDSSDGTIEGDYVLIYNSSTDKYNEQSTGLISGIDTRESPSSRSAGIYSKQLDYMPESIELDEDFDFSAFSVDSEEYDVHDERTFEIENISTGRKNAIDFTAMYAGTNCYVWVPKVDSTVNSIISDDEDLTDEELLDKNTDEDISEYEEEIANKEDINEVIETEEEIEEKEIETDNEDTLIETDVVADLKSDINGRAISYGDERDYIASRTMAESVGKTFDEKIYNEMTDNFGDPVDPEGTGKTNILMYDIQCGNNPAGYVGGFFSSADLYEENSGNGAAMLHIDTYPSIYNKNGDRGAASKCYSTVVHEFQHLINYSNYFRNVESNVSGARSMEVWLNEAMSMAAEEMIFPESSLPMRLSYYLSDYYGIIKNGHSLYDFDNSLENYSLSALFSSYLENQTGDYSVFSEISNNFVNSEKGAIENAVSGSELDGMSFEDIVAAYKIALVANTENSIYGFDGDSALNNLKPLQYIKDNTSVMLRGGGSVVVKTIDHTFTPDESADSDIKFIGITKVVDSVRITKKPDKNMLVAKEEFDLEATANVGGVDTDVEWSSSKPEVATVDLNTGKLTAVAQGETVITATSGEFSDKFVLTVENTFITIENKKSKIFIGDTDYKVEANLRAGNGETIEWASSEPSIATITPIGGTNEAAITAVSEGETVITATVQKITRSVEVDSFVLTVTKKAPIPSDGIEIDITDKTIFVLEDKGMESVAQIVNTDTPPSSIDKGLEGWKVKLNNNVELDNWTPIGVDVSTPFKGEFSGEGYKIVLNDTVAIPLNYSGLFGVNDGIVNDVNINIRGTVIGEKVGGVVGLNWGTVNNSIVTISDSGEISSIGNGGHESNTVAGGVVGFNGGGSERYKEVFVINSKVTNNGKIATTGGSAGGVVGKNQGFVDKYATIKDAEVYNNGIISSEDDTGGILGLNHGWTESATGHLHPARIIGKLSVVVTDKGSITSTAGGGLASVGGAIGFSMGSGQVSGDIDVRVDGKIISMLGTGHSGGFMGEGSLNDRGNNTTVSVTLGPKLEITEAKKGFGLVMGSTIAISLDKWVYAVPYDSPLLAFPIPTGYEDINPKIRRIEYPSEDNPTPSKIVDKEIDTYVKNDGTNDGIFKPKTAIKELNAENVADKNMLELSSGGKVVRSKVKTEPNYFDFNIITDGLTIVVPAYLGLKNDNKSNPRLDITSKEGNLKDIEADAKNNKVDSNENVIIKSIDANITDWTLEKFDNSIVNYVNYKPNQDLSVNTSKNIEFTLNETGLYKISAGAKGVDGTVLPIVTKYIYIERKPEIYYPDLEINGKHLTPGKTEDWTNLKDSGILPISNRDISNTEYLQIEPVTITAKNTVIEKNGQKKEAIPYDVELTKNEKNKKEFTLYETGRYVITARGIGIPDEKVKYINIDVDYPEAPSIKPEGSDNIIKEGSTISSKTPYEVILPVENMIQSPIHVEYSTTKDGGFSALTTKTITVNPTSEVLRLKTVDKATNESRIVEYNLSGINITITGNHLTDEKDEVWTNLSDSGIKDEVNSTPTSPVWLKIELVDVEAEGTTIENIDVKKGESKHDIVLVDGGLNTTNAKFHLKETGRYVIKANGVGMEADREKVKYINIDVDCPAMSLIKLPSGTTGIQNGSYIKADTDYVTIIPVEGPEQSPLHIEYRIDGGAFMPQTNEFIRLTSNNRLLELIAVDAAGNKSEIATYRIKRRSSDDGDSGGGSSSSEPTEKKPVLKEKIKEELVVNEEVVEKGYIYGYIDGSFGPEKSVTRAELAAMLDRLLILNNTQPGLVVFKDTDGLWAQNNINRLANTNIVIGVGGGMFEPNRSITREEIAAMLCRALDLDEFSDVCMLIDIDNSFAKKDIAKAYNAGLITGYENYTFKPKDNITRAEAVVMLNRIFLNPDSSEKENIFNDITRSMWYCSDVLKAIVVE